MSISSAKYKEIMNGYYSRRMQNDKEALARLEEIRKKLPVYKELEDMTADISVSAALKMIQSKNSSHEEISQKLRARLDTINSEKARILETAGFPADYTEVRFDCPLCMDTGFVDNSPCKCLQKRIRDELYAQSNLAGILERENFSTMTFDLYNESERESIQRIVDDAKRFISGFDTDGLGRGLLFFGSTGAGKTFLSNCIAKELLDSGHSVIYFTAFSLFEMLAKNTFSRSDMEDRQSIPSDITDCDLLVIDDLGSETTNSFTTSMLFVILNERHLRNRSTIISTNLDLSRIKDIYSERCSSRIIADFNFYHFDGRDMRPLMRGYSVS